MKWRSILLIALVAFVATAASASEEELVIFHYEPFTY
jgi:hypothetical protein